GHGFVTFAPVRYHGRLAGYMVAVLRPKEWLPAVFHHVATGFSIEVTDSAHIIYSRGHGVQAFAQHRRLSVLGQRLSLTVAPTVDTLRAVLDHLPFVLLGAGLVLTALASLLAWSLSTARERARALTVLNETLEQRVTERTQSLAHELAERRQTEEALAEERERLRVTLLSIGDGIIATDAQGRITLINRAAEALTGWNTAQATGQPVNRVFALLDEDTHGALDGPVERALRLGTEHGLGQACLLRSRQGVERPVATSAAPIRDQAQRVVGAVLVFRDISEHRALEEEALKSRGLESLGILAGGIAHDFNNILTALIGNLTLAGTRPLEGDVRSALTDAERAAWRARELTQQLLTFARGGAPIRRRGSVTDTIRDVCPFFLKGSHVQCQIDLPDQLWPVEFDPDQLGQVLHNLALNALEAMPEAGVFRVQGRNRVVAPGDVSGLQPGPYVELQFSDTGPGIPKNQLSRVFDPYFSTKSSGTGLGLSIVHSIIKRHHGIAMAESPPGQGARFTIYLPAVEGAEAATPVVTPPITPPVRPETHGGAHILVMDDDDAVRKVARGLLQALGYRVTDTTRGEEAVARYREVCHTADAFAAVLLDLTIPGGMGGLECLRALQALDPQVRGIVSTGYHQDPVIAQYADFGFCAAVAKPFRLEDLASAVSAALQFAHEAQAQA
ncbi:MAG TPA: ATP-binding protein, partial [Acidiferrobacteraceae bacterium]|nr:ATP-binding protein [Acidiferrobacteraceae bacterium]